MIAAFIRDALCINATVVQLLTGLGLDRADDSVTAIAALADARILANESIELTFSVQIAQAYLPTVTRIFGHLLALETVTVVAIYRKRKEMKSSVK